jgi:hypothetical protein
MSTGYELGGPRIEYNIKILGINFHPKTGQTTDNNWAQLTGKIRAQASETYNRELGIEQRIQCIHTYLMAKAWYVAQILPLPTSYERQLNTTIDWYVWNGAIFKVPLSTLQRQKEKGGLDLVNIGATSRALYYHRMETQRKKDGSMTAEWLKRWGLNKRSQNLPNRNAIPPNLEYIRLIGMDSACV